MNEEEEREGDYFVQIGTYRSKQNEGSLSS